MTRAAAYARLSAVDDFLRLGWMPSPALDGTVPHGEYAVLMLWLCDCEPVMPTRKH